MRKKQTGPSGFIIMAAILLLAACASAPPTQNEQASQNTAPAVIIETPPPQRPRWISQTPESAEFLYFTGMAEADSEPEARIAAVRNGFAETAGFYGSLIQSETTDHSVFIEDMGRTIAEATTYDDKTNSYTNTIISEVRAVEYYTETYRARNTHVSYKVWALCRVSRQKAEEERANFAKNISEQYTRLLDTRYDTLSGALSAYNGVYAALEQNPLHRTIAVYGDGQSLFEYCRQRITEITDSVSFDDIPPQSVQKGGTPAVPVRVSSLLFANAGPLECTVTIQGGNRSVPGGTWTVGGDNSFLLRLPASALEAGNYTVTLELNALSSAVTRNPKTSFPLEVRPASAEIRFAGETLSGAEQRVLSQAVQQALQTYHVPLLAGYEFLVTFNTRTQKEPFAGTDILICDVSVSLTGAGDVLFQSAAGRITEISRDHALILAAEYIRNNRDFWDGAARHIRR
jgi:hypothetical protein